MGHSYSFLDVQASIYGPGGNVSLAGDEAGVEQGGITVTPADGQDWLMRPVLRGLCRYEGLKDGTLSLEDVALMNDALTVQEENERRFMAAKEKERA